MTSGLHLPLLFRLNYKVGQRKSGTISVVNRGEEKVRLHMNVAPRSAFSVPPRMSVGSTICAHTATQHNIHINKETVRWAQSV